MADAPEDTTRISRRTAAVVSAIAVVVVAIVIVLVAGGGSSHSSGTSVDPATVVPSTAALYAGAVLRPDGTLKTAASASGRALSRQADPYLHLVKVLQTPGSPPLDFQHDIAPWLGPNGAIFLSSLGSSEASLEQLLPLLTQGLLGGSSSASAFPFASHSVQGALVLDTSDLASARSFVESQAQHAGSQAASYRGVPYRATRAGLAFAIVHRLVVIGSVVGVQRVIDTTLGGPSLASAPGYAKLLAAAPAQTLAHIYIDPRAHGSAGPLGLLAGSAETNVSLVPSTSSIAVDADTLAAGDAGPGGLLASASEGARAAAELPGESWLAVGLGKVGATLTKDVAGLRALVSLGSSLGGSGETASAAPFSLNALLEGILSPLSAMGADTAQAKRDFQSWMGPIGIFASGSGLAELRAGVVIASKDPSQSQAAVGKLATALRKSGASVAPTSVGGAQTAVSVGLTGLPIPLTIADGRSPGGQSRFVIGLGEASAETALNPKSTLSSSPSYSAAGAALGEGIQPSITADFPTFLALIEAVGLSEDPTISKFVPYLHAATTLAGGGKSIGEGIARFRVVLGLQQTAG